MIPQRTLAGTCEITTGALAITQRPPIYTGESAALKVEVSFTFQNVAYPIPSGVVAEMYLKFPNTEKMTVAVPMEISGNAASGVLSGEQTGLEGYPLLIIQLTDTETASLIVACATTVKVSDVRGNLVVDTRAPTPSEIVYVGRSPYIDPTTKHWITWDTEQAKYVDTGINAEGVIGYTPNISIGTVQSVPTGESAEVTRTGTDENPIFNFKLPRSGDGVGIYPVSIPIAVAEWVEESGVYKYTFSDATIKAYMTVLESWLDDEAVQLGKVWYTVNNGSLIVNTDVVPTAAWALHVTLGTDGTDVLEDVADIRLGKSVNASSLELLKTNLINIAMSIYAENSRSKLLRWMCNFTGTEFVNGATYTGYLKVISATSDYLYFVWNASSNIGDVVAMGYSNGTWYISNLSAEIDNVQAEIATPTITGTTNNTDVIILAGRYFNLNGALCVAISNIVPGATFTNGTNYRVVSEGGLNALYNLLKPSNTTNGLTYTSAQYEAGGYNRIGNLIVIGIRVTITAELTGYPSVVSGFPRPQDQANAVISLSVNEPDITAFVNGIGEIAIHAKTNTIPANTLLLISGIYVSI